MGPPPKGRKGSGNGKGRLPAWVVPAILILVIGLLAFLVLSPKGPGGQVTGGQTAGSAALAPASDWPHTHGFAVDPQNPNRLFIGTHGLSVLELEVGGKPMMRVANNRYDHMGYAAHPVNGRIHLSSGHPPGGGNLGVVKSEDGGLTWRRIDTIPGRQVDFHAMTVSPANPSTLYAWYYADRKFYRSEDGGVTWNNPAASGLPPSVISLAAHPAESSTLLAGTQTGIYRSTDGGASWSALQNDLSGGPVLALAFDPKSPDVIYASGQALGLWKSTDGGKRFRPASQGLPPTDSPQFIAIGPANTTTLYASLGSKAIYRSEDGGGSWSLLWAPGG